MILQGDCIEKLKQLENESVHCCVTSPPYFNLRDYGVDGQIGQEETLDEYINKLVAVFREVKRVLRDDGTLWINLGDTYCSTAPATMGDPHFKKENSQEANRARKRYRVPTPDGMKPKDLMGIPWTLAFALRQDGWYLRQDIIWNKPNVMPEAVKDRCTKSHEYIFLFSKSKRYYFDYEAIKEPCVTKKGNNKTFRGGGVYTANHSFYNHTLVQKTSIGNKENETGLRNKRSVWTVATSGYKGLHFATFPAKLIEPCILAGCIKGGTVLDCFLGSGTTAEVAIVNDRKFIGIDINKDYCNLSEERILKIEKCKIELKKKGVNYE